MDKSTTNNISSADSISPLSYDPLYLANQFRSDPMNSTDGINWSSAFDDDASTTFPTDSFPGLDDWETCPDLYNLSSNDSNTFNHDTLAQLPIQRLNSTSPTLSNDGAKESKKLTGNETKKRTKMEKPDQRSACWTSPLCPNSGKEGVHPDPSTCNGGCAPFLFDDTKKWDLPISTINREEDEEEEEEPVVAVSTRSSTKLNKRDTRVKTETTNDRKHSRRKSVIASSPEENNTKSPSSKTSKGRQPHHEIERKYRESINSHLDTLRRAIPSLKQEATEEADIEDLATAAKPSKGAILAGAVAHIKHQDRERRQLERENELLKQQVKALSALVTCEDCSLMQYVIGLNLGNNRAQLSQ